MKTMTIRGMALASAGSILLCSLPAAAQQTPVTVVPGAQYEADGLKRTLLGGNWRELWTTPLRVPVLDLGGFAGGLTPERQGGGNQSITLHMVDAGGRGWVFRSIDKFPANALPSEFDGSLLGHVVADQISALNPGSHFIMPRLLEAVGILHVEPTLFVMPDDARLGEFRATFAGMLGELEAKPEEGPDDTPGFAGSRKVKGSDGFLDDLEDSPEYRLDAHEFLRARLVDLLVGDPDRGTDQWRWARFGEKGDYVYRPIPRDRDWAVVRASGPVAKLGRSFYPKAVEFGETYSSIGAMTYSSHILDRHLLTELTRANFVQAAAAVTGALSDDVIAAAVADMPPELAARAGAGIAADLRTRRAGLHDMALRFYDWLATEVDVRGTDEDDVADIEHGADGTVRVRLSSTKAPGANGAAATYFDRVFLPSETNEVRVYLHGGDDRATVNGPRGGIIVRVIGGGGDDVLDDRTGSARFYDHRGDNEFVRVSGTRVDTKPWDPPDPPEGLRFGTRWAPDWGSRESLVNPAFDYSEAGVIVGVGPSFTRQGFRRLPHKWHARAKALYAIGTGGFGVELDADYRFMNSRRAATLDAYGTQFDVFRFYGLGNDTPELDPADTRVLQDRVYVYPALAWHIGRRAGAPRPEEEAEAEEAAAEDESGVQRPFAQERVPGPRGMFAVGPVLKWTRMRPQAGAPLDAGQTGGFGQAGARAFLELRNTDRDAAPRRGYGLNADVSAFPAVWDAGSAFGRVQGEATGYLPLIGETHLALRAGGAQVFGDAFPVFESAFIGGRPSLRGYRSDRFAGDAALYGGAELRVPLGTVHLIVNGELGAFALADAGRVFVDGASPGGWHTGFGGGLWFAAFDKAVSVAYAQGERGQLYLWMGLPY